MSRERDRLVKERTAHVNRIKGQLRQKGMVVGKPRCCDWLIWLADQRDWQGKALPENLFAEVQHEHERLMLLAGRMRRWSAHPKRPIGLLRRLGRLTTVCFCAG